MGDQKVGRVALLKALAAAGGVGLLVVPVAIKGRSGLLVVLFTLLSLNFRVKSLSVGC